jgi:hypothetical protein
MKPIIHRRCSTCGWWQVRAETTTTFMYTPCEFHGLLIRRLFMPATQMLKTDVEIVE